MKMKQKDADDGMLYDRCFFFFFLHAHGNGFERTKHMGG
jgi:hypothetical protein